MKTRHCIYLALLGTIAGCQHNGATPTSDGTVIVEDPAVAAAPRVAGPPAVGAPAPAPMGTGAAAADPPGAPTGRPNIIYILADDLTTNLVQYMPHVLEMEKEGTSFSHFFVANSLCCPSRAAIFTGEFPHNTGVLTNAKRTGAYAAFQAHGDESKTFAVALQRGGYKTAMMGKYLNHYEPRDPVAAGWTEWDVAGNGYPEFNYNMSLNGRIQHFGQSPQDYLTDVLDGLAQGFMHRSAGSPFFLEVATFAPHASHGDRDPAIPAPRDENLLPGLRAPRTGAYGARPDGASPSWLRNVPAITPELAARLDDAFRHRALAVQALDKLIGDVRALAASQPNTYVFFSSDNGFHLGDYSLHPGKMTPYDVDARVPLVVVGPGIPAGRTVDALVSSIDLCPTFAELGQAPPGVIQPDGRSITPFLRGETPEWRRSVLIEHTNPRLAAGDDDPDMPSVLTGIPVTYEAVRTATALYVEYASNEVEYHDLTRDPDELHNTVASLPAPIRQRFHQVVQALASCRGEACWEAQKQAP